LLSSGGAEVGDGSLASGPLSSRRRRCAMGRWGRFRGGPVNVRPWHASNALITIGRVGSLALSGRAFDEREPRRLRHRLQPRSRGSSAALDRRRAARTRSSRPPPRRSAAGAPLRPLGCRAAQPHRQFQLFSRRPMCLVPSGQRHRPVPGPVSRHRVAHRRHGIPWTRAVGCPAEDWLPCDRAN